MDLPPGYDAAHSTTDSHEWKSMARRRPRISARPWLGLILALVVSCGCQLFRDFDSIALDEPRCQPDARADCRCANGAEGLQKCTSDGRWSRCICSDAGGDADISADIDQSADAADTARGDVGPDADSSQTGTPDNGPETDSDGNS